ncbi:hypothetical protein U9M48_016610 [Paspalum notatum var. saurae]|uniref:Avr9/Cf-9 rapidly elicited protein 146 n=1 Tax=Paspalum notatum var. saurae TaxID=547442 RepID=A0AAQ3T7Y6_PASNO
MAVAKRMWSYLRAVFLMARKGLLSNKRRLLLTMHLLAKRRGGVNKAVARTVAALLRSSHNHTSALRRRDYEFSCTNSPAARADDHYAASPAPPLDRIEYCYYAASPAAASPGLLMRDLAPGEDDDQCCGAAGASPDLLLSSAAAGRFSVRVSNFSSEDEGAGGEAVVDHDAEEFIRRFYDQLRRQNAVAMLPYMHEAAAA